MVFGERHRPKVLGLKGQNTIARGTSPGFVPRYGGVRWLKAKITVAVEQAVSLAFSQLWKLFLSRS